MGTRIPRRKTAQIGWNHDEGQPNSVRTSALEANVQAIKRWERTILLARSKAEQVSDWIAYTAGSGPVLVLHVVWFGAWVTVNAGVVRGVRPFDPFPFPFLTMTVSLEAIFVALFVLASQNRLARQAEKRSHLDLQIDLLAEREMTAVLQLLQDFARHLDVQTTVTAEQLEDLMKKTDLRRFTDRMEELAEPVNAAASSPASALQSSNACQRRIIPGANRYQSQTCCAGRLRGRPGTSLTTAQTNSFVGEWKASQPDHGGGDCAFHCRGDVAEHLRRASALQFDGMSVPNGRTGEDASKRR